MRSPRRREGADSMPARGWCRPRSLAPEHGAQAGRGGRGGMEQMVGESASPLMKTLRQRPKGGTLWGALAILLLLTGVAVGAPLTWHRSMTLGAMVPAPPIGTASPETEGSMEAPLTEPQWHSYGDSVMAGETREVEQTEYLLLRAERSTPNGKKRPRKNRGDRNRNCSVRSLMVKVRDLGLGFHSDEIVRFKYCSGSCHGSRTNYDLTLDNLLQKKAITPGTPSHVASHPCCRPSRYEAISFMNVQNTWQTVEKLSAAACKCVG